jgi:hypothetical protein
MKFLGQPFFDDNQALVNLSENKQLSSYGELIQYRRQILAAYAAYQAAHGNVENFQSIGLPASLGEKLAKHYSRPPVELSVLEILRKSSLKVCPMCGSYGHGTLDHIFPRSPFTEFSVFTKNLVPACICNTKRKNNYKGAVGERVLHPYFDDFMNQRLIRASFLGTFPTPTIDLEVCYSGENQNAVRYHLETIIRRTEIFKYLTDEWVTILRQPFDLHLELKQCRPLNIPNIKMALQSILQRLDNEFGTPNNWKSILFAGIVFDMNAITFLCHHLKGLADGSINPEDI